MVQEVGRNDPCPCGSGKKYKKCCMLKQRDRAAERLNHREGIQKSLAWINRHYQPQIEQWLEDVWLADINDADRQGITSADPTIRGIHDVNLLEQLVAEGSFSGMEGENRPLQLILAADDLHLDEDQRRYLEQLQNRPLRLYRVTACTPGESFALQEYAARDAEPVVIADKWASRMFDVGDTVGMRLMKTNVQTEGQTDGEWETSGAIYHIPDEYVDELQAALKKVKAAEYSRTLIHFWLELVAAHV